MISNGDCFPIRDRSWSLPAVLAVLAWSTPAPALTIDFIHGGGFVPEAAAALERAAAQWSSALADPVTVTINTDFKDLGDPRVIGNASSLTLTTTNDGFDLVRDRLVADGAGEPDDGIVAALPTLSQFNPRLPDGFSFNNEISGTKANFKALGFSRLDTVFGATDAFINFNTLFGFDYDNRDGVSPGVMDFETVAAHELGHALGFVSIVDAVDGAAGGAVSPRILDLFRFPDGDIPRDAVEFTTAPRELRPGRAAVTSDTVSDFPMSTGVNGGDGRQASHFKDDAFAGVEHIGILDPTLTLGQAFEVTAADLRALDLIGYEVAVVPLPPAWILMLPAVLMLPGRRRLSE